MSLRRMIYYCTVMAGWAAFAAWLVTEPLYRFDRNDSNSGEYLLVIATAAVIGAAVGMSVNVVAGMSNGQWRQLVRRAIVGLLGGGIGGMVGGPLGNMLYHHGLPRALGWMVMGIGIGMIEGLYDRAARKVMYGVVGGALGGWLGGFLFDPIVHFAATDSGMASRAASIVVLGLCIGAAISLAQVVLKDAWLTVVDGYRTGRQLNLTQAVTVLGRSDLLPLPFLGPQNKDLGQEHLFIIRRPGGSFELRDNQSVLGTLVNSQPVTAPVTLGDGDVIRLGANLVRFNLRPRIWAFFVSSNKAPAPLATPSAPAPPKLNLAPQNISSPWSGTSETPPPLPGIPPRPAKPWRGTPLPPAPPPPK